MRLPVLAPGPRRPDEQSEYDVGLDGDPLADPAARDGAVRDWRIWAKTTARLRPTTINNTLAALDDFYTHRALYMLTTDGRPHGSDQQRTT